MTISSTRSLVSASATAAAARAEPSSPLSTTLSVVLRRIASVSRGSRASALAILSILLPQGFEGNARCALLRDLLVATLGGRELMAVHDRRHLEHALVVW